MTFRNLAQSYSHYQVMELFQLYTYIVFLRVMCYFDTNTFIEKVFINVEVIDRIIIKTKVIDRTENWIWSLNCDDINPLSFFEDEFVYTTSLINLKEIDAWHFLKSIKEKICKKKQNKLTYWATTIT